MFTNIVIIPIFLYNSNTSGIAAIFIFLKICNIFRILVIIITVPYYYYILHYGTRTGIIIVPFNLKSVLLRKP
uniref:Uncharacterized protein n=1 Tax=Podoviridae sp. ctG4L18 TaxID=2825234 RepID=A0A8S5UPE7_9CAUD|nr:MAG TPA: hypothetical protein [Podoviridae sp. ctG4L18]